MSGDEPEARSKLLPVLVALAAVLLAVVAVMSTVTLVQQGDIQSNTDDIQVAQDQLRVAQRKLARAQKKLARVQKRLAGVDALCVVALQQRHALEQQVANSRQYLASPAAKEAPGLSSFVRALSLPQLEARLKTERPPRVCREIVKRG